MWFTESRILFYKQALKYYDIILPIPPLKLSEAVKKIKEDKRVVCVLGGDHSVGIGSIHGHMTSYGGKEEPCVLWVDAHADINTIKSSESGSMHGMPMSFHIKDIYKENKNLKHMEWFKPT